MQETQSRGVQALVKWNREQRKGNLVDQGNNYVDSGGSEVVVAKRGKGFKKCSVTTTKLKRT